MEGKETETKTLPPARIDFEDTGSAHSQKTRLHPIVYQSMTYIHDTWTTTNSSMVTQYAFSMARKPCEFSIKTESSDPQEGYEFQKVLWYL